MRVMVTRAAGWPRARPGELNLSTAGFWFRSSTSSATGLNPSSFRRAFRMRRIGSHTGPANSVKGQVCDAGHGHPHRKMASSVARELNLSTAGFCFRSSTSSSTGPNPSNFRRAFRMRRVGSHTGRSGKFCERTRTDRCAMHELNGGESKAHPRSSRGSTIAAEAFMSHTPQPRLSRAATARATLVRFRDFATSMAKNSLNVLSGASISNSVV